MGKNIIRIVREDRNRDGDPSLIVLHATEGHNRSGVSDLVGLAEWFTQSGDDSTFGVDQEGNSIRMKWDEQVPFTQLQYNEISLSIEQVGFSSSKKRYWIRDYHRGLRRVSEIIAIWSMKWDIPIKFSTKRGVCEHRHLGSAGGGHHDCGPGYPLDYVLLWARLIRWRRRGSKRSAIKTARNLKRRLLGEQRRTAGRVKGT